MVKNILLVGVGGFLGAITRYLSVQLITGYTGVKTFPLGTMFVNITGCFLLGFCFGLAMTKELISPEVRLLFFTGFLGSFTTYSTFGVESFHLFKTGNHLGAIFNVSAHVITGLAAVWVGDLLSKTL